MKKLFLILILFGLGCKAQQIPSEYIGTWTNQTATDTIFVTATTVIWTSNEPHTFVSTLASVVHTEVRYFAFKVEPNEYILSFEKAGRNKLYFFAQTEEGFERANDTYFKEGVRQ